MFICMFLIQLPKFSRALCQRHMRHEHTNYWCTHTGAGKGPSSTPANIARFASHLRHGTLTWCENRICTQGRGKWEMSEIGGGDLGAEEATWKLLISQRNLKLQQAKGAVRRWYFIGLFFFFSHFPFLGGEEWGVGKAGKVVFPSQLQQHHQLLIFI